MPSEWERFCFWSFYRRKQWIFLLFIKQYGRWWYCDTLVNDITGHDIYLVFYDYIVLGDRNIDITVGYDAFPYVTTMTGIASSVDFDVESIQPRQNGLPYFRRISPRTIKSSLWFPHSHALSKTMDYVFLWSDSSTEIGLKNMQHFIYLFA